MACGEVGNQRVDCVVAIELGFLEGEQIGLFDEDVNPSMKTGERDLCDEDAVELLDEHGLGIAGVIVARFSFAIVTESVMTPDILPITVLRN